MRLILNGGGHGKRVKESYELFSREVNGGKVLYVPLAWNHDNMDQCINWFKGEMVPFGINDIEQILDPNDITKEKLKETSGVFIGGGNTYQLLKGLKETRGFENLKEYIENGGLVMGGSAGALIFSECIDTCLKDDLAIKSCNDENKVGLKDTKGFNCINGYSILPHYKKLPEQYEDTQKRVDKLLKRGYKLVCLPEETSLWINGNQMTIIGQKPAEIFDGREKKVIQAEEDVLCKTIILTSYLDFYEKDELGNKTAHNFGNDNGILDCLKANIKKYDNFVFVANGMEGEKAEQYFKLACESFAMTMPFKNYDFLCTSAKDRAEELIKKADFIFLCGGHLPTQNKFFNDIGLKELLKNTNTLIVGGSAGSMNCADIVYCPPELEEEVLDENFNRYLKGLGLTNINIMPHFEEYQKMTICGKRYIDDIVVPDSYKIDIVALNNGSFIVVNNNHATIYGESYLLQNGKIKLICKNNNNKQIEGENE